VPELFESTLQLRERRLDLEELLVEERKSAEALKKESDTLMKKVKLCFTSWFLSLACLQPPHSQFRVCMYFLFFAEESVEEQSAGSGR